MDENDRNIVVYLCTFPICMKVGATQLQATVGHAYIISPFYHNKSKEWEDDWLEFMLAW